MRTINSANVRVKLLHINSNAPIKYSEEVLRELKQHVAEGTLLSIPTSRAAANDFSAVVLECDSYVSLDYAYVDYVLVEV